MINGLVSLIIFTIELCILITVVILNRDHPHFWTVISILLLLQLYQLSEFLICIGINPQVFGRIGYVIITFLPPTGYFLAVKLTNWRYKDYYLGFAIATAFSLIYLIDTSSVVLLDCNPLYATYYSKFPLAYGFFYYGYLFLGVALLFYSLTLNNIERTNSKLSLLLLIGYLSFIVPMHLMTLIDPAYLSVVPSIMCKYALLLAVILGIFSFVKPKKQDTVIEEEKVEKQ
ncbi:MAG: hypothetical protein ACTSQE_12710 [Candidatus Heimdallarchaeaceae archaeon]